MIQMQTSIHRPETVHQHVDWR